MLGTLLTKYSRCFVRRPMAHRHKIRKLKALFAEASARVAGFQKETGLACVRRCGACCESPHIETTELEMLPLAEELIRQGKAEEWYARAEAQGFQGRCVFYLASPSERMGGCCQVYRLRPLICRLFGFGGNRDKHGRVRLVTCKVIKANQSAVAERVLGDVSSGAVVPPVMADFIFRASSFDPELSGESLPINMAFRRAVERLWLHERLDTRSSGRSRS